MVSINIKVELSNLLRFGDNHSNNRGVNRDMHGKKVLIMTVGGSDKPLVTCIKYHKPDFIYFICSSDSKNIKGSYIMIEQEVPAPSPCINCKWTPGPGLSLVKQAELVPGSYEIVPVNPDNLEDCYLKSVNTVRRARDEYPGADVQVDYTGGTKTMSSGLAVAAADERCIFSLVKGNRIDLSKVRDGTERVAVLKVARVTVERQLQFARELSRDWNYAGSVSVLEAVGSEASYEDEHVIQYLLDIARGLEAWDSFNYSTAVNMLEIYKRDSFIAEYYTSLKQTLVVLEWYKGDKPIFPGINLYFPVYDCLRNSQRRAGQKKYDDAVSRLYRATEMYAQLCLRSLGIKTDDVDLFLLHEEIRDKYLKRKEERGKLQLGLRDAYLLLGELKHPLGNLYESVECKLIDALKARNGSFLAHGFTPVQEKDYMKLYDVVNYLISEGDKALGVNENLSSYRQLPFLP
jgi:CRISPR-associated protein (TIGR02710 family)